MSKSQFFEITYKGYDIKEQIETEQQGVCVIKPMKAYLDFIDCFPKKLSKSHYRSVDRQHNSKLLDYYIKNISNDESNTDGVYYISEYIKEFAIINGKTTLEIPCKKTYYDKIVSVAEVVVKYIAKQQKMYKYKSTTNIYVNKEVKQKVAVKLDVIKDKKEVLL